MEIEIDSKRNNPLLKRTEIFFTVKHEGEGTPNREIIKSELAEKLNVKKENIIVSSINSGFGIHQVTGYAKVYTSDKKSKDLEPDYILIRNKLIADEKKDKKKVEAPAKPEAKPAEPAPEEKPAPTTEEPPAGDQPKQEPTEEKPEVKLDEEKPSTEEPPAPDKQKEEIKDEKPATEEPKADVSSEEPSAKESEEKKVESTAEEKKKEEKDTEEKSEDKKE